MTTDTRTYKRVSKRVKPVGYKSLASKIFIYAGLVLYFVWLFFPFLIIIITSFATDAELLGSLSFVWLPKPSIEGYRLIFTVDPNAVNGVSSLVIGFFNVLWQAMIPTVSGLIVSGLAAFAYAKYDFPGRNKLFAANLLLMTIPLSAGMTSYLFYNAIGWTKGGASVLPLIIPGMFGSAGLIFFMYPYIKSVPTGIIEAAKIDGMGFFRIFFTVVMPLSTPVFLAQFLFGFVGYYNNYSNALIYLMNEKSLWTLQLALDQICTYVAGSGGYMNAQCAAVVISILPILVLYCFVQKSFISGLTAGSVKG